jgi:Sulfotransferase family
MTIDSSRKVLFFLHVPKTAGTTIVNEVLNCQYSHDPPVESSRGWVRSGLLFFPGADGFFKAREPTIDPEFLTALSDPMVTAVVGHYAYGLHSYLPDRAAAYMTVVREPTARVWSLIRHLEAWLPDGEVVGDAGLPYHRGVDAQTLFEQFALRELDNDQTRRVAGLEPAFGECTSDLLELAKHRVEADFEFVGTVERLDESLRLASLTFAWERPLEYWRSNVNTEVPPVEIDPSLRRMILDHNRLDQELYEHVTRLLDERIRERVGLESTNGC